MNAIAALGDLVYLATGDVARELVVVDVSDPQHPLGQPIRPDTEHRGVHVNARGQRKHAEIAFRTIVGP